LIAAIIGVRSADAVVAIDNYLSHLWMFYLLALVGGFAANKII